MLPRVMPSILLSSMLLSPQFGEVPKECDITESQKVVINNKSGENAIKVRMYFLQAGAGVTFNVQQGKLDANLSISNIDKVQNNVTFNVSQGGELNLTNGKNGFSQGIFQGSNTTLNAEIFGSINGNIGNDGRSKITIKNGGTMKGNISQSAGTLETRVEGTLNGGILIGKGVTQTGLWAYNNDSNITEQKATITGNITQEGGGLQGIMKGLHLQGSFTQNGGWSDIAFHQSKFDGSVTLSQTNATIHFYESKISAISTTGGNNKINLKGNVNTKAGGSHMQGYTGVNSTTTLSLESKSSMQSATQTRGEFTLKATDSKVNGSITGNQTKLTATLIDSEISGNITNSGTTRNIGNTNINTKNSTIGGNITQSGGQINARLDETKLKGGFLQNKGNLARLETHNSTINQGIFLTEVEAQFRGPHIAMENTTVNNGIHITNSHDTITGNISDRSSITDGYFQEGGGRVAITFKNSSSLQGGIKTHNGNSQITNATSPEEYLTTLIFKDQSSYTGGITSTQHTTWIELNENSTGEGKITVTGGNAYIKGMTGSTITGDLISNDTEETRLYLGRGTFNGNVIQTNGKQHISLIQNARLNGSITNLNTQSVFAIDTNSTMTGGYTQSSETLQLLMGGNSMVTGSFTLNDVNTTLSNGTAEIHTETIRGNFTQNNGTLSGLLEGLTLEGKFTQNGGTANVTFSKANFHNPTDINNAISSNIIFDNGSQLKTYTINNSPRNSNDQIVHSLKLDHQTTLTGDFILNESSSKLSVINGSKITGSIISSHEDNKIVIDANKGEVEGNIQISKGHSSGDFKNIIIGGNVELTDANSHFHIKDSNIRGNIHIIRGTNLVTLDHTSVGGWFKMEGEGQTQPTLKLKISNGSNIGGDLTFKDTNAFLGGEGIENIINGNFISENSTLTNGGSKYEGGSGNPYPASGLIIAQDFKQTQGVLDLTLINQSHIRGNTRIQDAVFSNLHFKGNGSLKAFQAIGGNDNTLVIENRSTQEGGITLNQTSTTIQALQESTITSKLDITQSNAKIFLKESSRLIGDIQQNAKSLLLDFSNKSGMQGNLNLANTKMDIKLKQSAIDGDLIVLKSQISIDMQNQSFMQTDINSTASSFLINANSSRLSGGIIHSGSKVDGFDFEMNFKNHSTLDNTSIALTGKMLINSEESEISSREGIEVINGRFDLNLAQQSSGRIIELKTSGSNIINVRTSMRSNSIIDSITMEDQSTLTLVAQSEASIAGTLLLKTKANANISSLSNAQIKFDIIPQDSASLEIALNGGILQGKIIQDNPILGRATLGTSGNFGGRWIMTENSALNELIIDNPYMYVSDIEGRMQQETLMSQISIVDMRFDTLGNNRVGLDLIPTNQTPQEGQTTARTLALSNLGGLNGVFRVYADIGAGLSDKLTTQKASGNHIIQVDYNPATFTQDINDKYIVVAHVDDPKTSANFEGADFNRGTQAFKTNLIRVEIDGGKGFDWILGSIQNTGPSYGTKVIASIMQSQYRSFSLQNETLNQRLGELRGIKRIDGLWARYSMGKTKTQESDTHIPLEDNFYSVWVGYDQNLLNLKGQDFYGFALSYTLVDPQSKDYTGKIHNIGFNFYNVFIAKNDFYVDLVAKYILSQGTYDISYYSLSKNKPKYINHKLMFNIEFGKKFRLGDKERQNYFYLQPEAQITSGYIHSNDINFFDNSNTLIKAHLPYSFPVIMRAGLNAAYSMNYFSFKGDIRLGTSLIYEMSTGGRIALNDEQSEVDYKFDGNFRMMLHAGANLILNDSSRLYFEASTEFLGETNIVYGINAGVRFTFGHKNTRKLKVPSSLTPPPPPKPQYDPRNIPTITDNTKVDIQNNKTMKKTPYSQDYFINTRKSFRDKTSINH